MSTTTATNTINIDFDSIDDTTHWTDEGDTTYCPITEETADVNIAWPFGMTCSECEGTVHPAPG